MAATFTVLGFIMIAAMVHTCTGSPLLQSAHEAQEVSEPREIGGTQVQRGARSRDMRTERFAPLPEDQQRFTSKQLLQALSGKCRRTEIIFTLGSSLIHASFCPFSCFDRNDPAGRLHFRLSGLGGLRAPQYGLKFLINDHHLSAFH